VGEDSAQNVPGSKRCLRWANAGYFRPLTRQSGGFPGVGTSRRDNLSVKTERRREALGELQTDVDVGLLAQAV